MPTLAEHVARRTDLGTFIVHLTRDTNGQSAKSNLLTIIEQKQIDARSPFGSAIQLLRAAIKGGKATAEDLESQNAVCFTETPLEHLHLLLTEITDASRLCQFAPYGIAITKKLARKKGINPIWYLDITPGHNWLTKPLNALIDQAIEVGDFKNSRIALLAPFTEQMGSQTSQSGYYRKEFWWEREWRFKGNFILPDRVIILAPEEDHQEFGQIAQRSNIKVNFVDPKWGIEEIIARLAGFTADEVGPF